jgi:hypothetical protein
MAVGGFSELVCVAPEMKRGTEVRVKTDVVRKLTSGEVGKPARALG